jgi:hypothetical protein
MTTLSPFLHGYHCASGKIQVGCIGSSAVQYGPCTQRFPLVSSLKQTSRWEKKFDNDDEVQEVMMWFKGQAADSMTQGYGSWFQDLIKAFVSLPSRHVS